MDNINNKNIDDLNNDDNKALEQSTYEMETLKIAGYNREEEEKRLLKKRKRKYKKEN